MRSPPHARRRRRGDVWRCCSAALSVGETRPPQRPRGHFDADGPSPDVSMHTRLSPRHLSVSSKSSHAALEPRRRPRAGFALSATAWGRCWAPGLLKDRDRVCSLTAQSSASPSLTIRCAAAPRSAAVQSAARDRRVPLLDIADHVTMSKSRSVVSSAQLYANCRSCGTAQPLGSTLAAVLFTS